jgi:DNA-binding NarL/FixJ family response regulator
MTAYRVLVVDEDPSYRWEIQQALGRDTALRVVAEAGNGHEALSLAEANRPDIVLISRRLPGLSGLQVAAAIRRQLRRVHVLLLAQVIGDAQLTEAARVGVSAVLPKSVDAQVLRTAVRSILAGVELPHSRPFAHTASVAVDLHTDDLAMLTARELEVLDCLLIGHSTKETGAALAIADQTVKNRVSSILHKLNVAGRVAAIRLALTRGWADYGTTPEIGSIQQGFSSPADHPQIVDLQRRPIPLVTPQTRELIYKWG